MKLFELIGIIDFEFDIADDEIDASFYIGLDEIRRDYSKEIEVVRIDRELIVCKLTDFLRRKAQFHPNEIKKYLEDSYYEGEQRTYLIEQLTKRQSPKTPKADITDDGGEAVYHFIEHDMYDFLTEEKEEQKVEPSMYEIVYSIEGISEGPEITDVLADSANDAVASVLKVFPCATIGRVMKEVKDWKKEG